MAVIAFQIKLPAVTPGSGIKQRHLLLQAEGGEEKKIPVPLDEGFSPEQTVAAGVRVQGRVHVVKENDRDATSEPTVWISGFALAPDKPAPIGVGDISERLVDDATAITLAAANAAPTPPPAPPAAQAGDATVAATAVAPAA